jgi:hypothetical protein
MRAMYGMHQLGLGSGLQAMQLDAGLHRGDLPPRRMLRKLPPRR